MAVKNVKINVCLGNNSEKLLKKMLLIGNSQISVCVVRVMSISAQTVFGNSSTECFFRTLISLLTGLDGTRSSLLVRQEDNFVLQLITSTFGVSNTTGT